MNCQCCKSDSGILKGYPFEMIEALYKNVYAGHEVFTHKCKACNALYIGVGLETREGNQVYWSEIGYPEVQELLKIKGMPEIVDQVIALIQGKDSHIHCNLKGQYTYKPEPAVIE